MTIAQALERLRDRCSRCEYSSGQVRKKLLQWDIREKRCGNAGFFPDEIEDAIESLISDKYVDDIRFANAYVRDKARFAKWGPAKIAYNLKVLGVEQSVINCALEGNSDMFAGNLLAELVENKWSSMRREESVQTKKSKIVRFALGRGFSYDQIMEAIKDLG